MSSFTTPAPSVRSFNLPREISVALLGILLLALSARIQVPFWPVPMTLQTLTVMALGLTLGPLRGASVTLSYLLTGLVGMPVFAGAAAGAAVFAGPTAGFLLAMPVMAAIAGLGRDKGLVLRSLALLTATVVLYAAGLAWLGQFVPSERLLAVGLLPFLAGDSVKIALAALLPAAVRRVRRTV